MIFSVRKFLYTNHSECPEKTEKADCLSELTSYLQLLKNSNYRLKINN